MYESAWITMCLYVYECICVSWVRICIRVGKGLLAAQVFSLFFDFFFDFFPFLLKYNGLFYLYIYFCDRYVLLTRSGRSRHLCSDTM